MNAVDPNESAAPPVDRLFSAVYDELRRVARGQRSRSDGDTLDTTALVHELYLQMSRNDNFRFAGTHQFYAYAARAMRHLLVDRARGRARIKHGGELVRVDLDDAADAVQVSAEQALELDRALVELAADDPRAAEVVELHYFGGLPVERIAELLGLSTRTVDRDWLYARAFLHSRVGS
jgi:RNA polymerase sigma factor (TIGR02999 family)